MTTRTAILGGGALGLTLAYRLARAGEQVVVFESEPLAGGLAAGFRVGDDSPWLEKFYHHLFRTDRDAVALIGELGLGHKLEWIHANTSHLINGKPQRLDGIIPALTFAPLPPLDRLRLLGGIGFLHLWPFWRLFEGRTASAWIKRWMGPRAYQIAFEPLFRGKFGTYADVIALPWIWARLHDRTPELGYLQDGFQQVYEALVAAIAASGGEVRLGVPVQAVRTDGPSKFAVATAAGTEHVTRVVSTLAPQVTYRLVPELPADFRNRYDWRLAYGAHCLILALDRPLLHDVYWLSIADPGYPFLAVVEHTNMQPRERYGGRHLVYLGNYLPMDHPLMRASTAEALAQFLPHLSRINPQFAPEWVTASWSFAAPFAQPIVTPQYVEHIPPHETPLPGFYLANMFQVYPQDRGQNYSIRLANGLAAKLLGERTTRPA
jgi:protoporphyrinogen oxidase